MRIKIVVQRYGSEILGGAERHAALVAGLLSRHHDVEVFTTTAGDYETWSPAYPAGECEVDGVRVRRFPVARGRSSVWRDVSALLHEGIDSAGFASLPQTTRDAFAARVRGWPDELQEAFIRGQGPSAPDLIEALARQEFERALFVTYLYPTTYDGLAAVDPERSRVIPTLHDEPPAYLPAFGRRLGRSTLLCSTDVERRLLARLYPGVRVSATTIGYGLAVPSDEPPVEARAPFLLYAGRVDAHKGLGELLSWYAALRRCVADPPRLVVIGSSAVTSPLADLPEVDVRGFVSEADKLSLMREALAFVHPSPFESLGIVLLEAMALRRPVVVNARSEVLVDHCRRGGSGLWVRDAAEFVAAIERLRRSPHVARALGASGRAYVEREYSLDAYERRLLREFPPGP